MATADNLRLSSDQKDLLLAALTSNTSTSPFFGTPGLSQHYGRIIAEQEEASQPSTMYDIPTSLSYEHSPPLPSGSLSGGFPHDTPLLGTDMEFGDWDIEDGNWDYDLGGENAHGSPDSQNGNTENEDASVVVKTESEKRKEPPQGTADPHDAEPKRRDDKDNANKATAKKPGRKPLTSEPTSKRKAQNRAAQRAFRERKEKHLKDLEQKVEDLQKASESANHENGLLRAQIDRLQTELREYKRRLQSSELRQSSLGLGSLPGFQFDFPPFGTTSNSFSRANSLPKLKDTPKPLDKPLVLDGSSNGATTGSSSKLPSQSPPNTIHSSISDLFSPSIIESVNKSTSPDYMSGYDGTPKTSGGRDSSSPSVSSVSQHGAGSSCATSPEPMNNSPISSKALDPLNSISEEKVTTTVAPNGETYICKSGSLDGLTETTFCEKLGMACGNPHNPIPKAPQFSTASETTANSLDWLTQQSNAANFDPVFNDYRDPVNDINSNLNVSFFDDAFSVPGYGDVGSPLKGTDADEKKDLIAQVDAVNDDDDEDEVVPGDDPKKMLSCNKIWDRISSHPRFVSGELDMDGLCSELRSKAKCSEVGVVVAETDVQEVLGKVGMSKKDII